MAFLQSLCVYCKPAIDFFLPPVTAKVWSSCSHLYEHSRCCIPEKNITRVISLLHEPLPFIDKYYNHPGYRICSSLQKRTRTTQSEVAGDETNNAPLTKTTLGAAGRGSGPNVPCYSLPFALSPAVDAPRTIKPFGRSAWQRTSIYIRTVLPNLNFNVYWLSKPHGIGFHDAMISLEKSFISGEFWRYIGQTRMRKVAPDICSQYLSWMPR